MAMATAAPAANAKKRSYSVYMSCQSSSSALSLTLQKKIFSWKLRENAGATLVDDFYFAFY